MKMVVLGAGHMSPAIVTELLTEPSVEEVLVADCDKKALKRLEKNYGHKKLRTTRIDVTRSKDVRKTLRDATCVVGATSYAHNVLLTKACIKEGAHFCDLGGNNTVVAEQYTHHKEAQKKGVTIIPDCGLAPGMVNVLAYHWAQSFSHVKHLKIRVGGLPQKPCNLLQYQLAFSVQGLINEYIELVDIVHEGKKKTVLPMGGVETLSFGDAYPSLEAFYTSGGISTLPKTLRGHVDHMDYKTIRYQGHAAHIQLLIDLGLFSSEDVKTSTQKVNPRDLLAHALSAYLPQGEPDVVLMRIEIEGTQKNTHKHVVFDCVDVRNEAQRLSAMQRTTGFSIALVANMLARGEVKKTGVVPQELALDGAAFLQGLKKCGIVWKEA